MIQKRKTRKAAPPLREGRQSNAKGDDTKSRIIDVAITLFAARGFDQTSTRDVAALAGVNAPAVHYYFGGKKGLYWACAEHMGQKGRALMAPVLAATKLALKGNLPEEALIECVCEIASAAADATMLTKEMEAWTRLMAWDDLANLHSDTSAQKIIDKYFRAEIRSSVREIISRITKKPATHIETRIRAVTLMAQIGIFFSTRDSALFELGWTHVDIEKVRTLKIIISDQLRSALRAAHANAISQG